MRCAILLVPVIAFLLAACDGGGGKAELTPSPSPAATRPSPTVEPTPEPTPTPTPIPEAQTAVTTERGTYIVRPDGRQLRGPIAGLLGFDWSPDGAHLGVVTSHCDRIFSVATPDSGSTKEIASFPGLSGFIGGFEWAPDSQRLLAGISEPSGATRVFMVNASGHGEPIELLQSAFFAWSPDATEIAYIDGSELKLMDVSDRETRTLVADATAGPNPSWSPPVWSPDGKQIAFPVSTGQLYTDLAVMNVDGSGRNVLAAGASPTWTADGQLLVFIRTDEAGRSSVVARASDGSVENTLRTGFGFDISRDGHIIAVYDNLQTHTEIEVFRDGDSLGIVSGDLMPVGGVALSPDGTRLIFNAESTEHAGRRNLYLVNSNGTGLRKLVESTVGVGRASWSPDGDNIAFVAVPPIGLQC